jgi:hypothetical protein
MIEIDSHLAALAAKLAEAGQDVVDRMAADGVDADAIELVAAHNAAVHAEALERVRRWFEAIAAGVDPEAVAAALGFRPVVAAEGLADMRPQGRA